MSLKFILWEYLLCLIKRQISQHHYVSRLLKMEILIEGTVLP